MGWSNTAFQLLIVVAQPGGFSGLFVYSPAPGPGNLIASVAAQAGTDPYGNAYQPIVTIYGSNGASLFLNIGGSGFPGIGFKSGAAEESLQGAIFESILNPGVSEQLQLSMTGPGSTGGFGTPGINLFSAAKDGSKVGSGSLSSGNEQFLSWAGGKGLVQTFGAGGSKSGGIPASQRDFFTRTANTIGFTGVSVAYNVPGNEVVAGMEGFTYRVKAAGDGIWVNTASGSMQLIAYGSSRQTFAFALSTAFYPTGDHFQWVTELDITVKTVGAAGTALIDGTMSFIDITGGGSPFVMVCNQSVNPAFAIDTTTASTIQLNWNWSGAGPAGTLNCYTSELNRIPSQPAT